MSENGLVRVGVLRVVLTIHVVYIKGEEIALLEEVETVLREEA